MTTEAWSFAAGMAFMLVLLVCGELVNRRQEHRARAGHERRCRCSLIGHQWERSDGAYVLAVCLRKCCRGHERGIYRTGAAPRPDVSDLLHLPDRFDQR